MDFFSISQASSARAEQCNAISSLPIYFMWSTNVIIVCPTFDEFADKTGGYLSRGHCLMELATAKLPRIDVFGKWYIPGIDKVRGEWGKVTVVSAETNETRDLAWADFQNAGSPLQGNFTVTDDLLLIRPLLEAYVQAYDEFNTIFMKQLRECATWEDAAKMNTDDLPQMLVVLIRSKNCPNNREFATPADWAEDTLPESYVQMLKDSILNS
jgi:hypothetical protein